MRAATSVAATAGHRTAAVQPLVPVRPGTGRAARVSIVLPCRNEERHIGACLDSIAASEYAHELMELLVVDGCSNDGTRRIVERFAAKHPWTRLLDNPARVVPHALNQGILAATGDIIVRMDAHVIYPPDYLPRLIAALQSSGADNVGGRIVTLAANDSAVARAIALVMAHPLGVGNAWFRIGTTVPRRVDTVPFGCYRRDVFTRVGLFDEELVRNQDDEFNHRLIRSGGRILLVPDVVSYYYARDSFARMSRMYYQYGLFKPLVARKVRRVMTVRQLIPAAFVAAVPGLALLALKWPAAAVLWGVMVGVYVLAVSACALAAVHRHGIACALALALAFPILHVSYGIGFLRGLPGLARAFPARADPASVPLTR